MEEVREPMLTGFFVGWPNPPKPETHLRILRGSYKAIVAIDDRTGMVVGFINAVSDGVLAAFIPLLEVLPDYRGRGIGSKLTKRMIYSLRDLYSIDLICDSSLQPYYERLGLVTATGMMLRNYEKQSGKRPTL